MKRDKAAAAAVSETTHAHWHAARPCHLSRRDDTRLHAQRRRERPRNGRIFHVSSTNLVSALMDDVACSTAHYCTDCEVMMDCGKTECGSNERGLGKIRSFCLSASFLCVNQHVNHHSSKPADLRELGGVLVDEWHPGKLHSFELRTSK